MTPTGYLFPAWLELSVNGVSWLRFECKGSGELPPPFSWKRHVTPEGEVRESRCTVTRLGLDIKDRVWKFETVFRESREAASLTERGI